MLTFFINAQCFFVNLKLKICNKSYFDLDWIVYINININKRVINKF